MEAALVRNDVVGLVDLMKQTIGESLSTGDTGKQSLEVLKTILQSSLNTVNAQLTNINKLNAVSLATSTGSILLEVDNVQCFEPRGRFNLKVTSTSIVLEGKQFSVLIPVQAVEEVLCLPSFTSAKKEGEDYLAFKLEEPVKINNKDSKHILLNLSRTNNPSTRSVSGDNDQSEAAVVMMAIQDATGVHISRPQSSLFSTVRDQKSYLKCYKGTQEGAIYPMPCGVVFIKPLLFISADEIASISAGRGGGAGNTRFVDLMIETADEKTHEFTNIDRDELPALNMYVKGYLEARAIKQQQRNQKKSSSQSGKSAASAVKLEGSGVVDLRDDGEAGEGEHEGEDGEEGSDEEEEGEGGATINDLEDSDDSDEDDDDYNPDDGSDSDAPRNKRKSHRAGSGAEGEENDSQDSDSDDSDDSDASDSDNSDDSDADSDASGDQEILKTTVVASGKAPRVGRKPVATKVRSPSASPMKTAVKKSPAKKAETVKSPAKKAVPGMPVQRAVPQPGQPINRSEGTAVHDLTSEKGVVSAPGAKAKEGRKASAPVKKAPKEALSNGRSAASNSVKPGSAVVKRESEWSSVVLVDDNSEVQLVEVKPEVQTVVNLIDPALAAAKAFSTASAAPAVPVPIATQPVPVVAVKTEKTTASSSTSGNAPATGVKRTIMDMFAPIKKATIAAPVKVEEMDVVKLEDA